MHDENEHALTDDGSDRALSPARGANGSTIWQPRKTSANTAAISLPGWTQRRGRQKSLGEALHSIHTRRASVTDNARELGEALKAPVSPKLIVSQICQSDTQMTRQMTDTSYSFFVAFGT